MSNSHPSPSKKLVNEIFTDCKLNNARSDRYLRLHQIIGKGGILPISRSTFYAKVQAGEIPPPLKLGERISVWREGDILAFAEGGTGK